METAEGLAGGGGMQDDRDGAVVHSGWKDGHASEGLGAEDVGQIRCALAAKSVSAAFSGTADQQAANLLVRAAEDGLAFVEQDSGVGGHDRPGQSAGVDAGCVPGVVADHVEQFQAEGLSGLLFPRTNIEIRRGAKGDIAVSMDGPDGEQAELLRSGIEVFLEESPQAEEHLISRAAAGRGLDGSV